MELFDQQPPNDPTPDTPLDRVRLCLVPGVGPKLYRLLIGRFGSAQAVLLAAPSALREVPGIGPKLAQAIALADTDDSLSERIAAWRADGLRLLLAGEADYPPALQEIHDPPALLFARGKLLARDRLAVAIVGTRHMSVYGRQMTERLTAGLVRAGYTIISGLARGIDAVAHETALRLNGRTVAVLGSGIRRIYPPEHAELAERITESGALIGENDPDAAPMKGSFPQRNRIISGLSQAVIVIEAGLTSGALITARHALEQGRDVMAVPGRADHEHARGCHRLIRDGAKLIETVDDILEELGPLPAPAKTADGTVITHTAQLQLNELERAIYDRITVEAVAIDLIIAGSGLPAGQVLATLSVLEMKRLIRRLSGQLV